MSRYASKERVKCNDCGLERAHAHCPCGQPLPSIIIYMEKREPVVGEVHRIIPSNYVVMCPACGDGVMIRVKQRQTLQ